MKIHLTGTHWQGATTDNLKIEFEKLGHTVYFFEKNISGFAKKFSILASRLARHPRDVENQVFETTSRRWLTSLSYFKPDLIIIEDAPNLLAPLVNQARALNVPIFYYEVSPPHGSGAREILLSFRYVDEFFCIDRDWMKIAHHFFLKPMHHLPLAGSPKDFYPIAESEKVYDVVFVGSVPEQSPDGLLRANLAQEIPKRYRVGLFGRGWNYWLKSFPGLKGRIVPEGFPNTRRVNEIYNQSKIIVNFHSTGHSSSISSRTFEIALAGAFQIVDYRPDLKLLFPNHSFPIFEYATDLNNLIDQWIERDTDRDQVATSLREWALRHHTWEERVKKILSVFMTYSARA